MSVKPRLTRGREVEKSVTASMQTAIKGSNVKGYQGNKDADADAVKSAIDQRIIDARIALHQLEALVFQLEKRLEPITRSSDSVELVGGNVGAEDLSPVEVHIQDLEHRMLDAGIRLRNLMRCLAV